MFSQLRQLRLSLGLVALILGFQVHAFNAGRDVPPELKGKRSYVKRDGVDYTVFEHDATGATIDFVTNSGICETTPGVNQYSGYVSVGKNQSMWFWFFEARHNPETAPLALWFNGGPGCSSMIGLFQENGPCTFNGNTSEPVLNPYSWNEYANLLYVDEPIGTGFSYGNDTVDGTIAAAPLVWILLQAFFANFPRYRGREFGLFTESYGGHYGPGFAYYFESQNQAIIEEHVKGQIIDLVALGINNGWYDAVIQEYQYPIFSVNNTYYPLINESIATAYVKDIVDICEPPLKECTSATGEVAQCEAARNACFSVDDQYSAYYPDIDPYDIRQKSENPFPPETYVTYLQNPAIQKAIGAKVLYEECTDSVDTLFAAFADDERSFIPDLSSVVRSGVTTVIWAGDADSVCDWFGGFASVQTIDYAGQPAFKEKEVTNYAVNGKVGGEFKTVENLSWLRVFESGHEVPAFQPELALQVFKQTISKKPLYST